MKPTDYYVLLALAAVLVLVWVLRRPGLRTRRPGDLSGKAAKAWQHLSQKGYSYAGAEPRASVGLRVDGRVQETEVRADLLVRRWGRRYVVLTDRQLLRGRLQSLKARHQLMSILWAFGAHAIILYNPGTDTAREIRMWVREYPRWFWPLAAGLGAGIALGYRVFGG